MAERQKRTYTEQMHDVCACGDWRKQHPLAGKCLVCGDSRHPADGCQQFRVFKECRMTFEVVTSPEAVSDRG